GPPGLAVEEGARSGRGGASGGGEPRLGRRAGDEAARDLHHRALVRAHVAAEQEHRLADAERARAARDDLARDLPAVDERAVPALEIAHHEPLAVELHLGVLARHPLVVEPLAAAVLPSAVDLSRQERQRAQRGGARGVEEEETRTRRARASS